MNNLFLAVSVFIVNFVYISIKASQQLRVMRAEYFWMVPTSLAMAACEVFMVGSIAVTRQWWLFIPIGLAGVLGCMLSVWFHEYLHKKKEIPSAL